MLDTTRTPAADLGPTPKAGQRIAEVYVCCLVEMAEHADRLRPSHIASLVPGFEQPPTPSFLEPDRHLRVELDDIDAPLEALILPQEDHIRRYIDFVDRWDAAQPLLVHCAAGVSRSTAGALIAAARRSSESEEALVERLRGLAPHAQPNRRIVELADKVMGRDGRLINALSLIEPQKKADRAPLVRLPFILKTG